MRMASVRGIAACGIVGLVALLVLSGIPGLSEAYTPPVGTRAGELILKVGGQDEMKGRNPLPPTANDVWTSDVHYRIFDTILQGDPQTSQPMAYIAKGVDFNEDGTFSPSTEYNVWAEQPGATSNLTITIYYDFNGARWGDATGTQMTVWDLFFAYHLNAQNARFNTGLRVLYCDPVPTTTYESCERQLGIRLVNKNWEGEGMMPGNPALRWAVEYALNQPFALFYTSTLYPVMLPMYEWSRTGGGRHADFGCAAWIPTAEAALRGISACGTNNAALYGMGVKPTDIVPGSKPYDYTTAEAWPMTDADVIGNGPFKSLTWTQGTEAKVVRNEDMYTGIDYSTNPPTHYDDRLASILQKPIIDGIRFIVKKNTQVGVLALKSGEIDFYHWNVPAEFVPELLNDPNIAVGANAEPGFFYFAYNLRNAPWGYTNGDPSRDDGLILRQAISHVIDKKSIVQNLLQNFGEIGYGVLSPSNTYWYNDNIPKPEFDLPQAMSILDSAQARAVGIGAKPSNQIDTLCDQNNPAQCRVLPRIGNLPFYILTPTADYDPVRSAAGAMVASAMRQVGLNAVSQPTAFGVIVNKISTHDFDVYILGWRIGGTDPDYLFDFFHSSNAPNGQNYVGFNNATFDNVIDRSRAELDRATRRGYIFTAERIIAEKRPYDVLYYRKNIESYRQDRFTGWRGSSGSIWNYWSLQFIHAPTGASLRVTAKVANSVASNGTLLGVSATVFDNTGRALPGAAVTWVASTGTFTSGGQTNTTFTLTTGATGRVSLDYNAPYATVLNTTFLTITARATGLDDATVNRAIAVYAPDQPFLQMVLGLPNGDLVAPGQILPMTIEVRDGLTQAVVGDANVAIATTAGGLLPVPASGLSATMRNVQLNASATINQATPFVVTVLATNATLSSTATQDVLVQPQTTVGYTCPNGQVVTNPAACPLNTPGLDVLPILGGIAVAAVIVGVLAERKRRS